MHFQKPLELLHFQGFFSVKVLFYAGLKLLSRPGANFLAKPLLTKILLAHTQTYFFLAKILLLYNQSN